MTVEKTGSDTPVPGEDKVDVVIPPTDTPTPPSPETDPDAAALAQAEAELAAALKAAEGQEPPKAPAPAAPTPEPKPGQPVPPDAPKAEPKADDRMVPVTALKQERAARRKAEIEAAELRGRTQALEEQVRTTGAPIPKETVKTPQQQIADINAEMQALAKRADAGEISLEEQEKQRQALEDKKWEIRQSSIPKPEPAQRTTDLAEETTIQKLHEHFPILATVTREDLEPLVALAYKQAQREGKPIQNGTAQGTLDLRIRVARLATDFYGGAKPATPPKTTPPANPTLSDTAKAREAAIAAASGHPPNVADLGRVGDAGGESPEAMLNKLNAMTEDAQLEFMKTNPKLFELINA